jgi:hypothetical protein
MNSILEKGWQTMRLHDRSTEFIPQRETLQYVKQTNKKQRRARASEQAREQK